MGPIPFLSFSDSDKTQNMTVGDNEVQIGGVNTSDPRFGSYKGYSGCVSSMFAVRFRHLRGKTWESKATLTQASKIQRELAA